MRTARGFALLLLLCSPAVARAQDTQGNTFNLQLFRPAVDSKGYFTVNASQILGHLDFSIGLIGSYARKTLVLEDRGLGFAVNDFVTAQVQAALGLFKRVELGLSLPVHILFGGRTPSYRAPVDGNLNNDLSFGAQFVGDLGIHSKVRFLDTSRHPVGLALLASLYLPTGKSNQFLGEGNVSIRPELIVDKEFGFFRRFRMSLNVGALIRIDKNTFTDRGTALTDPAINAGAPFCAPSTRPTPSAMSGSLPAPDDPACGTGLSRSLGTQLTYGLALSGAVVPGKLDLLLEVYGYADVTGSSGAHPLEWLAGAKVYLASKSYFQFGAGTGIIPGQTGSPLPRVFVGFIFEPAIGDRDADGIKDDVDQCPDDPEDRDDFEDQDGCPDPDNDRDRILDKDDQCPNEPETYNGFQDQDGCPDRGITLVRHGVIQTFEKIYFETAKATIKPVSYPILDAVAGSLKGNPQLKLVEVQGHADERGDDDYNLRLTEDRAQAVKQYLIEHGVEADRLMAHGYGETEPICRRHDDDCWSENRRVEFIIKRQEGKIAGQD